MFGGNSNWRGPVWMPTNYLAIVSLRNWDSFMGEDFPVEYPTGSGKEVRLRDVAEDIARPPGLDLARRRDDGRRPVYGTYEKFQTDPDWHDLLCSTSTSMATRAPGSARRTRPAGPAWSRT